jgi:hypothetical protein
VSKYRYDCSEYPGNEGCPGSFAAGSRDEVMRHAELHGQEAHGEDPQAWSADERRQVEELIRKA